LCRAEIFGLLAAQIPMKTTSLFLACLLSFVVRGLAADAPPSDVVLFDHAKVDALFAKGGSLLANSSYKVSAGRRTEAGQVEIHASDTDVFYIVEGSATFVTGGKAVDPKSTKPGEQLADKMTGGVAHHLTKGDVIVIPAGIAHQFTEVSGTFLYFVVKVTR
jgi:mannose-6-phosphate isomerase-like protein (cupin superfamily)